MKPSFHNSPELRFPLFDQEDEHGRFGVSITLLCLSSLNLSDMKISKCKRAANKVKNLFFVLNFMLAHVIMVDTCADDELDPDSDLRVNNTYTRTYRSKPIMKIHRPRYPNLDKFHQKLKRVVDRVRSLEQPVWLLSHDANRWQRACERTCVCFLEKKIISCWNHDLKVIPSEQIIPYDVRTVDLGMNEIGTLHKDTFRALVELEELDLFHNRLNYLPTTIFHGLRSLLKLKLSNNRLKEIPKRLLFQLNRLRSIDLSKNKLRTVPDSLFTWSSNTAAIFMYGNDIETLPAKLFRNLVHLEELDLSGNRICSLDESIFRGLADLKFLKLDENQLAGFPKEIFTDNKNLNILSLRKNRIIRLGAVLQNLPSLGYLDLATNKIAQFHGDEFADSISLRELNLHHNAIEKLQGDVFQNATHLQKLILSSNRITELRFNTSSLDQLVYLDLQYNMLRRLDEEIFEYWKNLKTLLINGNMIRNIPEENLDLFSKLNTISLANNMWHCDCNIFPLSRWLRTYKMKVLDISNVKCLEPSHLKDRLIQQIIFKDVCDIF